MSNHNGNGHGGGGDERTNSIVGSIQHLIELTSILQQHPQSNMMPILPPLPPIQQNHNQPFNNLNNHPLIQQLLNSSNNNNLNNIFSSFQQHSHNHHNNHHIHHNLFETNNHSPLVVPTPTTTTTTTINNNNNNNILNPEPILTSITSTPTSTQISTQTTSTQTTSTTSTTSTSQIQENNNRLTGKRKLGPFICEHEVCERLTTYAANKNRLRHERTPHGCDKETCQVCLEINEKATAAASTTKEQQKMCSHTGCQKMITISNYSRHIKKPHHFQGSGNSESEDILQPSIKKHQVKKNRDQPIHISLDNCQGCLEISKLKLPPSSSSSSTNQTMNNILNFNQSNNNNNQQPQQQPIINEPTLDIKLEDDNRWSYYLNTFSHTLKQYSIYLYDDPKLPIDQNNSLNLFKKINNKRLIGCYSDFFGLINEILKFERPTESDIFVKITFDIKVNKKKAFYQKIGCVQLLYYSKDPSIVRSVYDTHQFFISFSEMSDDAAQLFNSNELSMLNSDLLKFNENKININGKEYNLIFCLTSEMASLVGLIGVYGIFKIISFFKCVWCDVSLPLIGLMDKISKVDTVHDILGIEGNGADMSNTSIGLQVLLQQPSEIHLRSIEAMVSAFTHLSRFTPSTRKRIAKRFKGQIGGPLIPSIPFTSIVPEPLEMIAGIVKNLFRFQLREQSFVESTLANKQFESFLRTTANVTLFRGGSYHNLLKIRERFDHSIITPLDGMSILTKQDSFLSIVEAHSQHPLKQFIPLLWKQLWALLSIMLNPIDPITEVQYQRLTFQFGKLAVAIYGSTVISTSTHMLIHHIGYYLEKFGSLYKFASNGAKKRHHINNILVERAIKQESLDEQQDLTKKSLKEYQIDKRYRDTTEGPRISHYIKDLFQVSQFNIGELFDESIWEEIKEIQSTSSTTIISNGTVVTTLNSSSNNIGNGQNHHSNIQLDGSSNNINNNLLVNIDITGTGLSMGCPSSATPLLDVINGTPAAACPPGASLNMLHGTGMGCPGLSNSTSGTNSNNNNNVQSAHTLEDMLSLIESLDHTLTSVQRDDIDDIDTEE